MKDSSSIYHLISISNTINKYDKALKSISKINNETADIIFCAIFSQTLILTNSFLDEFDNFFTSKNTEELKKIKMIKNIVKPAIEQLRKWSDLKNFRNNVLVHNLRVDKDQFVSVFIEGKIHNYNIPKDIIDYQILVQCILMTKSIIMENYKLEYENFTKMIKSYPKENYGNKISNPQEFLDSIYFKIKSLAEKNKS